MIPATRRKSEPSTDSVPEEAIPLEEIASFSARVTEKRYSILRSFIHSIAFETTRLLDIIVGCDIGEPDLKT